MAVPPLDWQYSRNQRRYWHDNGVWKRNSPRFEIKSCTPYRYIPKASDGHDLYAWGQKVAHGRTVKELKLLAATMIETLKLCSTSKSKK